MAVYDSAKTRKAAQAIRRIANGIEGEVMPAFRSAAEPQEAFRGKTARAMEEKYFKLLKLTDRIGEEMTRLARQVEAYAESLEELDRQLAEKL